MLGKALARTDELVVQESGNELLIYDLKLNKAYCLNETSALVWRLCDGKRSVTEISDELSRHLSEPVDENFVWLALEQFNRDNLLEDGEMVNSHFAGVSRRDLIRKVGIASMVALPIVSSIVAPTAGMAQSALLANCSPCMAPGDCTSGNCSAFASLCAPPGSIGFPSGFPYVTSPGSCVATGPVACCSGAATEGAPGSCTCT